MEKVYPQTFQGQAYLHENVDRMAFVLSITDEEMAQGYNNYKVREMAQLLNIASHYWNKERRSIKRPSNRDARLRYEGRVPPELAELRLHVDFDTGLIGRKPIKRCEKCYDTNHERKCCPYKRVENVTPEVESMIKQRFDLVKAEEYNDPLLSKTYKERHYVKNVNNVKKKKSKKLKIFKEKRKVRKKEMKILRKTRKIQKNQTKVPVPNKSANTTAKCYHNHNITTSGTSISTQTEYLVSDGGGGVQPLNFHYKEAEAKANDYLSWEQIQGPTSFQF